MLTCTSFHPHFCSNAHHHDSLPQQLGVVWGLPLKADPEGPSLIYRAACPHGCLVHAELHFRVLLQHTKAQEVDRLRAFTTTLARVSIREATKFNELGLRQLQGKTEPSQPLHKCFLSTKSIRTILETQHEVVDIPHHAGLAPKPGLDHALEPQIEHIVKVQVTQQNADRSSLRGPLFIRMNLSILQNTCLQPAPDQTNQALISHPVLHEAEHPFMA